MVRRGLSVLLGVAGAALTGASAHPPDARPAVIHTRCLAAARNTRDNTARGGRVTRPDSAGRSGASGDSVGDHDSGASDGSVRNHDSGASDGSVRDHDTVGRGEVARLMAALRAGLKRRYGVGDESRVPQTPIVVPVRFHVITAGDQGRLSQEAVRAQIDTLNTAYGGGTGGTNAGVSFRLTNDPDYTDNAEWFSHPRDSERAMKTALHRGGAGTLNLYTTGSGSDVLGFSTFPETYQKQPTLDGVVIDYRSLPGGEFRHFDKGYTAVHEVGHWLGLFHTFQNGCVPPGDAVDDTPYEAVPTEGCPWVKDTCPAPGVDPVHNFMDYGYDDCMTEFTPGQARRIHAVWAVFREQSVGGHFRQT